jgi:hypothetical protein
MDDLAASMTDSLSRTGNGAMQAPLKHTDGLENAPSVTFNGDILTGLYSAAVGDLRATVSGVDRMRWLAANQFPQIWDSDASAWNDLGTGGITWIHSPVIPATTLLNKGYVTAGSQSTLMPATPALGASVAFADLNDDWSSENFLTLNGNGNTFTQDGTSVYNLDLKGAFAQFSFIDNQWQIVNFGRLSDAYGLSLEDYYNKNETNALLANKANPNLLINGGLDVWQSGFGTFEGPEYAADRWKIMAGFSQRSNDVPIDSAPASIQVTGVDPLDPTVFLSVELGNPDIGPAPFAQDTDYMLSFWAKRDTAGSFQITLSFVDSVGSATNEVIFFNGVTGEADIDTWRYYTMSFDIGAFVPVASNVALQIKIAAEATVSSLMTLALAKLEVGTIATAFIRAGNTLAGELSMCQRYFFNSAALGGVNRIQGLWDEGLTNVKFGNVQFPTVMRTPPVMTVTTYFGYTTAPPFFSSIGTSSSVFSGASNVSTESSGVDAYTALAEL